MMGGGNRARRLRHIVPNAIGTIVVNATFQVADAILLVVALSLPRPGHPAAADRLGRHAQRRHQRTSTTATGGMIFPAGVVIISSWSRFNFIGDALRDAFEVRLQQR